MNKRRGGSSLITRSFCYCCMRETDFEDNVYDLLIGYNSNVVKDIPSDFGNKIEETETKPVDNICTEPVKSETLTDEISKIAIKAIESKEYNIAYKLIAILTESVQ